MAFTASSPPLTSSQHVPTAPPPKIALNSSSTPATRLLSLSSKLPSAAFSSGLHLGCHGRQFCTLKAKAQADGGSDKQQREMEAEEVEVEEELPWIQEKALDLVEFSGSVSQAIPGPRVGRSSLPWALAVPLAYFGVTFVIAFVRTVNKFNSPREQRRQLVNKNATLCKSIDDLLQNGQTEVPHSAVKGLMQKTGFSTEDILRKYIRYAMNEKPFNPGTVAGLIQLREASTLSDSQIAEILNEISRRIVKDKGPVVMDASCYSEKGFKRKLAVQALFGKVLYLSELPRFCSRDSSLIIKEVFGVTDEDAEILKIQTLSEAGDMDLLERMVTGESSTESL